VKHGVDAVQRMTDDIHVTQITLDEVNVIDDRIEVAEMTSGEIVDDPNVVPLRDESVREVRSDEARPASNEAASVRW